MLWTTRIYYPFLPILTPNSLPIISNIDRGYGTPIPKLCQQPKS